MNHLDNGIIKVAFDEEEYFRFGVRGLKQWDRGQILEISGLDVLDKIVEVHFSLQERDGNAKRMVSTVIDGILRVDIPAFILEGPEWSNEYYNAWAWIYLSDEESAETVRKIEFTIEARPKPDEYVAPEELTFLQQLELAIQNKLDKSGHAPNKFLGTDEKGNVVTKEQEEFSLEVAGEEKLGGVKPLNKTDDMTLEVGVDKEGRLFTKGKDITVDSELSEESKNPVQNKVLTKEVNILKEHNTQLKETIEKLQIKVTTEKASFHNIKDSANMKVVDFGMEGKTEQETTSGKNLWSFKNSYESVGQGFLIPVGTPFNIPSGTYTLSFNGSASDVSFDMGFYDVNNTAIASCSNAITTGKNTNKFTLSADAVKVQLYVTGVVTLTDIQIELGPTATDYEPYTNGPSPNPDFEQEVENAGVYNEETGRYEIGCKVVNRNLWDAEFARDVNNWVKNEWYDYLPIRVQKGATISVSYNQVLNTGLGMFITISHDATQNTSNGKWLYHSTAAGLIVNKRSFVAENDYIYLHCHGIIGIDGQLDKFMQYIGNDLQIEIADAPTDLVSHASQPFTLTSPVPLTKWDYLTKRDGVYGWSVYQLPLAVDETALMGLYLTYKGFKMQALPESMLRKDGYCNQMPVYLGADEESTCGLLLGVNDNWIYNIYNPYYDDTLSDYGMANFKAHLAEHPLEIITYADEEQAFYPLPDEEQELLHNLETYYGVTNLYNDQGCPTWLTYIADPKLYLDNQLLEIKSAIV